MKRLIRNIAVGCLALGLASSVLAGEAVKIKLNDGKRWRGELADAVTVTMIERGRESSFTGTLVKVKDIYIVVKGAIGGQQMEKLIPISSIVSITDAAGDVAVVTDTANLVMVTGPSRTADIEQVLNLGVHGPRHVHIVLIK